VANEGICISVITRAELQYGAERSAKIAHNQQRVYLYCSPI